MKILSYKEYCENETIQFTKQELIAFTKKHVEKALKAASKVPLKEVKVQYEGVRAGGFHIEKEADVEGILNCYPTTNIK